jgi:hypothetical protein
MTSTVIVAISFLYLALLFAVAYFGDKRADAGRSIIANPDHLRPVAGGVLHHLDLLRQRRPGGLGGWASCRSSSGRPWWWPCGGSSC